MASYKDKYNTVKRMYLEYKSKNEGISNQYSRILNKYKVENDITLAELQKIFPDEFILYGINNIFSGLDIFQDFQIINNKNFVIKEKGEPEQVYRMNNTKLSIASISDVLLEKVTSTTRLSLNLVTNIDQGFRNYMNNADIFTKLLKENEITNAFVSHFINEKRNTYSSLSKVIMSFIFAEQYKLLLEIIDSKKVPNCDTIMPYYQYLNLLTFSEFTTLGNMTKFMKNGIDKEALTKQFLAELTKLVSDCSEFDRYANERYIKYNFSSISSKSIIESPSVNFLNMYYIYVLRESNLPLNVYSNIRSLRSPIIEKELGTFVDLDNYYSDGFRFDQEIFTQLIIKRETRIYVSSETLKLRDFVQIKQRHIFLPEYNISFPNCFECTIHNLLNYLYLKNPGVMLANIHETFKGFYVSYRNLIGDKQDQAAKMTGLLTNIPGISYNQVTTEGIQFDMIPKYPNFVKLIRYIFKIPEDKEYTQFLRSIYGDIIINDNTVDEIIFDNKYKIKLLGMHAEFYVLMNEEKKDKFTVYSTIDNTVHLINHYILRDELNFSYISYLFKKDKKEYPILNFDEIATIISLLNYYPKFRERISSNILEYVRNKGFDTSNISYLNFSNITAPTIRELIINHNVDIFNELLKHNRNESLIKELLEILNYEEKKKLSAIVKYEMCYDEKICRLVRNKLTK